MSNAALPCAHLIPLARDHLLPLARHHLLPLLSIIRSVPTEIAEMKLELEAIENFVNKADRMADSQEDNTSLRAKIKQLIEAYFYIQYVIDEYLIREDQQLPDPGCVAVANYVANCVKTKILRVHTAYKIKNIKSRIAVIKDTFEKDHGVPINSSWEIGSSSSSQNPNGTLLQNPWDAPSYMEETDVVGFEKPRGILIDWLVKGTAERTVVAIVGMGGLGKTTLAQKVFNDNEVVKHFDCHAWITVSQSYNKEELLKDILSQFYEQGVHPPQSLHQMNPLVEMRKCLQEKRYVVVFDDVWNINFWDEIKFAMIDNKNGSKVLITTRKEDVAYAFKRSRFHEVLELKSLSDEESLELFNKKVFHGCSPENVMEIPSKIIKKCKGLPLAIVVIGGLLSQKNRNKYEWDKSIEHVNTEFNRDSRINRILALSYHDLPNNLKPCLLYFGMYPEDYKVDAKMLIRQWIAEGFVKEDNGYTLEEVAEGYLIELIRRSLVHVVSMKIDGRAESCRVHDLVHAMILEKCKDLSFCKNISGEGQSSSSAIVGDGQSSSSAIVQRLSIASSSDNLVESIESSKVQSLFVFKSKTLPQSHVARIPSTYPVLKVLAIEQDGLLEVSRDWESLIQLKYLSVKQNYESSISIFGMLQNLETLDLRQGSIRKMPKEICNLTKLRHFLGHNMSLIGLKDRIGDMTSLQTLGNVYLYEGELEDDNRVVELIQELGKLKQLRELTVSGVTNRYMSALSSSINKMQQLKELAIHGKHRMIIINDLHLDSALPRLRYLRLTKTFSKSPEWIPKLQNLVMLELFESELKDDAIKLLKSMPNLLSLFLGNDAYIDESIHFENGSFKNLKELNLYRLEPLNNIRIDEGALPSLKKLRVVHPLNLNTVPDNIKHLKKLQVLHMENMNREFMKSVAPQEGKDHWIFKHATFTKISN